MSSPRVAIVEGDFVVGAWHVEAFLDGIPCDCGKCDLTRKSASRTLILCRRAKDYYTLDVRESGSEVTGLEVQGEASDEGVFEALGDELTVSLSDAFKDGGRVRIKSLRVFTSDLDEVKKKLDGFMGVCLRESTFRLERRGGT